MAVEEGIELTRIGRDELNLTEFPFALLANRPSKDSPSRLVFQDGQKEWVVEGSTAYGLPTSADVQVYVVLMELTRAQNFPPIVEFSRADVVRRLGWVHSGASYERLTLALDRLVSVTIRTRNAFYDASQRKWTTKEAFHILDSYKIADITRPREHSPSLTPSWIRWSTELYANMQAGYIKSLDVDTFLSLESVIAQALYRYLDAKRYDGKPLYRIGLRKLAFEHLGLSRNYYPSDIKRKLAPAHKELIEKGFIQGAEYAPMKSGEEMVIYRFAPKALREERREERPRSLPASTTSAEPAPTVPQAPTVSLLAQRLIDAGVSRAAAVELSASQPEECENQLQYLPFREAREPGAVLVRSIREGWAAPTAWVRAEEQRKNREKSERQRRHAEERVGHRAAEEGEFDAWWDGLSMDRQDEIRAQAIQALRRENRVLAEFAGRHPDSPMYQASLRPYLKKFSGWKAPAADKDRACG